MGKQCKSFYWQILTDFPFLLAVFLALIFTGVVIQLNPNAGKRLSFIIVLLTTLYQFKSEVKVLPADMVHSFAIVWSVLFVSLQHASS